MKEKVHRFFTSISTQVLFVIVILVVPLNIIAILGCNAALEGMVNQTVKAYQNLCGNSMDELRERMGKTQSMLYYLAEESPDYLSMQLQTKSSYDYLSAKYRFYYSLKNLDSVTNCADGYYYFFRGVDDVFVYPGVSTQSLGQGQQMVEAISDRVRQPLRSGWHICEIKSRQYLLFTVDTPNVVYGSWIGLDPYREKLEAEINQPKAAVSFTESRYEEAGAGNLDVFAQNSGILLHIRAMRSDIVSGVSVYQKILLAMAFLYLILVPCLYFFLRRLLLHPLFRMNRAFCRLRDGDQDFRLMEQAKSTEYREAYAAFNEMADTLKALKIESYEKEIAQQKMELKNLQLQIRPHFLLNTFNLVFTLAQRKETSAVQDVILYLSDYFRYIFREGKQLDLFQNELQLIQGYLKMISIRYLGKVTAEYNFSPEVMRVRVPPLLVHNFIENSVKHGMRPGESLHIRVAGTYENDRMTFRISDDGRGFTADELQAVNRMLRGEGAPKQPNAHVGLLNSIRRLKHFYGKESSISVASEPGRGTCVTITFLYRMEDNYESADGE